MKNIRVGDRKFPKLGLGTWQAKGEECTRAVKKALNVGYRHIDTAQAYGNEEKVGKGIQKSEVDRRDIWLTTKVWRDNTGSDVKQSVRESLNKLGTDHLDLLLIHWPFPKMDLESTLSEMSELVEEGSVKNIGVSNFTAEQMEKAVKISDTPIATNQVEYHPLLSQNNVLQKARELDTTLTAYSPLARAEVIGNRKIKQISKKYGKTEAQIALRWLIQQDDVIAIPKAVSENHIEQNINIYDFKLSDKDMKDIGRLADNQRKVDPSFAPDWD